VTNRKTSEDEEDEEEGDDSKFIISNFKEGQ
jgi:hypothetical protein